MLPKNRFPLWSRYNPFDELQLGATSRIMIAADEHDATLLLQEGCTPVRCTHIDCLATHQGQLLVQKQTKKKDKNKDTTTRLGDVSPLDAQVDSAPNILESDELCTAKSKITYKKGSFARRIWDRWHGNASAEDMRATEVHMPRYRVRDGHLQKKVLGSNADHVYAVVIPDDDTRLQNIIIKFYHEAAGHAGGPAQRPARMEPRPRMFHERPRDRGR